MKSSHIMPIYFVVLAVDRPSAAFKAYLKRQLAPRRANKVAFKVLEINLITPIHDSFLCELANQPGGSS